MSKKIEQESHILSEYKVVPLNNKGLCLLDPFLLIIIVGIIGIFIYILGVKYADEIHTNEENH